MSLSKLFIDEEAQCGDEFSDSQNDEVCTKSSPGSRSKRKQTFPKKTVGQKSDDTLPSLDGIFDEETTDEDGKIFVLPKKRGGEAVPENQHLPHLTTKRLKLDLDQKTLENPRKRPSPTLRQGQGYGYDSTERQPQKPAYLIGSSAARSQNPLLDYKIELSPTTKAYVSHQ